MRLPPGSIPYRKNPWAIACLEGAASMWIWLSRKSRKATRGLKPAPQSRFDLLSHIREASTRRLYESIGETSPDSNCSAQTGQSDLHGEAVPVLQVPEVAVALRECLEHGAIQVQYRRGIDRIEPVFLINGLAADDGPAALAFFEEVVEPPPAGNIHGHPVERRALEDVHLDLRDCPSAAQLARPAVERVQDVDAPVEPLAADLDEALSGTLKPGRSHPTVGVPDGRKAIPVSGVAP